MSIPVGISSCLLGHKVRFDGSHKAQRWMQDDLSKYFDFRHLCPEMAAGMPAPRKTLRLVKQGEDLRMLTNKGEVEDWTEQVSVIADQHADTLSGLCGFILTSKSPSCGMERVRVYHDDDSNMHEKNGVGLFAARLKELFPWMPLEEDGRLGDPMLRENFMLRVFALHDLHQSVFAKPSLGALVAFHSRYKLMLMAHSQVKYQELGRKVAHAASEYLDDFLRDYRLEFMQALAIKVNRKRHVNVLMHMMGYFKKQLSAKQKAELLEVINQYHQALVPLMSPLTLLNHYLNQYPNEYLEQQVYLNPYPSALRLRYGL